MAFGGGGGWGFVGGGGGWGGDSSFRARAAPARLAGAPRDTGVEALRRVADLLFPVYSIRSKSPAGSAEAIVRDTCDSARSWTRCQLRWT